MHDEHHSAIVGHLRRVGLVSADDSGDFQRLTLSGLASEQFRNVVRAHDFGFGSNPPAGAEGLLLPQGGRSDRAWALGFEHRDYRQKNLPSGATALYDSAGNVIKLVTSDGVKFDFQKNAWTVSSGGVKISANSDHVYIDPGGKNVFVGSPDGSGSAKVMTESGPSANVYAKV